MDFLDPLDSFSGGFRKSNKRENMETCATCNEIMDGEEITEGGSMNGKTYCDPCFDAIKFPKDVSLATLDEREST